MSSGLDAQNGGAHGGAPKRPFQDNRVLVALIGVAAVVIAALGITLAVVLFNGDDTTTADDTSATRTNPGPDPEFISYVNPALARLSASAQVTARELTSASRARDVARVSRTARQQLPLVQTMRARVAEAPVTRSSHRVTGELSRATQAHRQYLISLSRMTDLPTERAIASLPAARNQARKALAHYRAVGTQIPRSTAGITTAGIEDISGLRAALRDKRAAEVKAEREAEEARERERRQARASTPSSGSGGSGNTYAGPVVSGVNAHDAGSTVNISASYCDRTPGSVNHFVYTFTVTGPYGSTTDSYSASQTRACNQISWSFADGFPLGSYTVSVRVDNLTNGVSGSASGSLSVVN